MNPNQPINSPDNGVASIQSSYPFAETVARLLAKFEAHGIKVFATIDQQREAAAAGLTMPPATLILFGNPLAGTKLMLEQPACGIDLPLKIFVTETTPGAVQAIFNRAGYIIGRHALPPALEANLAAAERLIAQALAA